MHAEYQVRAIEPEDAERLRRMFFRLSPETVYLRFFRPVRAPSDKNLEFLSTVDHDAREAVVAVVGDEIVGVARYDRSGGPGPAEAETAIVVEDGWQHQGVARHLMIELTRRAQARGIEAFTATMLGDNRPVLAFMRSFAPGRIETHWESGELLARVPLAS
jgi:GNAT superfamily N-acetyltransferase